ncbi:hypothetical protein [Virgibacillus necropolis]|uniref:Uncharacterized protein n=1 Tax=Virgibacillus necropolis TaxID=163877 RepID=A0A221MHV7_9BACI|nr:hypothetical protein [Virgibacillus necropolis]ASN07243.1 hypothetical protein CFK40_20670 [Virgibacillus necropolis]
MKSFFYFVLTIIVLVAVTLNTDEGQENANNVKPTDKGSSVQVTNTMSSSLTSGLDKVLVSLDELQAVAEKSTDETKQIQDVAKKLGEDWDQIEKQVEQNYPEDYENIEKSLYPLLAEAKKEQPYLANVKQLIEATTKKVEAFKKSVGKTAS